jgi:hypothetical protein
MHDALSSQVSSKTIEKLDGKNSRREEVFAGATAALRVTVLLGFTDSTDVAFGKALNMRPL